MTIDTVLLKVASRCNLDCKYCYFYHSPDQGWLRQPARMSWETIDAVIARLAELSEHQKRPLAVVLHGGEPLLLGKAKLERLLEGLRSALGQESTIALQTNGTLVNDELVEVFAETRTVVGVSIDGPSDVNDKFRVDRCGRSSFSGTIAAIERLRDHPRRAEIFRGVLAVIDPHSDPEAVYEFFKSLKVPSVDFLLRDGNHDRLPYGKGSFESREYGRWMARLWELYVADPEPTPIEFLDNLVRGMFGAESTKEGSGVASYGILVVETDGTITKNDTLKNSFDGADLFCRNWSVHRNSFSEVTASAEYLQYAASQRTKHRECLECKLLPACGGGMMLHRWSADKGYDNPSVYCRDQKHLLNRVADTVLSIRT